MDSVNRSAPSFRDGALAPDPESRDSGFDADASPRNDELNNKHEREVPMKLHGYFRSSASYRVRIALNLKGLTADHLPHHLRKGEQRDPAYLAINPQGLVPTLDDGGPLLPQSLALIERLGETPPHPPRGPRSS